MPRLQALFGLSARGSSCPRSGSLRHRRRAGPAPQADRSRGAGARGRTRERAKIENNMPEEPTMPFEEMLSDCYNKLRLPDLEIRNALKISIIRC